jgi:hypothetical protein
MDLGHTKIEPLVKLLSTQLLGRLMCGNLSPRVGGLDALPVRDGDSDAVRAADTFNMNKARLGSSEAFHLVGHASVLGVVPGETLTSEDHRDRGWLHGSSLGKLLIAFYLGGEVIV